MKNLFEDSSPLVIESPVADDAAQLAKVQNETWLATYPNEEHGITVDDIRSKNFEHPMRIDL